MSTATIHSALQLGAAPVALRECICCRHLLLTAGDGLVESSERMSGRECEHADAVAVRVNRVVVIRIWMKTPRDNQAVATAAM